MVSESSTIPSDLIGINYNNSLNCTCFFCISFYDTMCVHLCCANSIIIIIISNCCHLACGFRKFVAMCDVIVKSTKPDKDKQLFNNPILRYKIHI